MENKQQGLLLLYKHREIVDELTDEEAGKLFKAIFAYEIDGVEPEEKLIRMSLIPFRQVLDSNKEKYNDLCQKNRENAMKRWHKEDTSVCDCMPTDTNECDSLPNMPKYKDKYKYKNKDKNINNNTIYDVVEQELDITLSPMNYEKINSLIEKYGEDKFKEALSIASNGNKKSLNYVEGVLKNNNYKKETIHPEWLDMDLSPKEKEWTDDDQRIYEEIFGREETH